MSINENEIRKILNDLLEHDSILPSDIPNIYLYMDQVTTFFDEKLAHFKRNESDKIFTKTMINNYTSANILFPSEKKKYNKHHLTILVWVYYLKQILSINDIHKLLSPITDNINSKKNDELFDINNIYNIFLDLERAELEDFKEKFTVRINRIDKSLENNSLEDKKKVELILLVLQLVIQANIQKTMAEKIIDEFFEDKKEAKEKH